MTPNVGYPVDFHKQAINNAVFQRLASAPASPVAGQYFVNTTDGLLYKRNEANTAWEAIGGNNTDAVTQASNSTLSGKMKVSAGANKSIVDYSGVDGIVKTAGGVPLRAVPNIDYVTPLELNHRIINVKVLAPDGTDHEAVVPGSVIGGVTMALGDMFACNADILGDFGVYVVGAEYSVITYAPSAYYVENTFSLYVQIPGGYKKVNDRAFHTGQQPSSTISDFNAAVDARIALETVGLWSDQGNYDASGGTFPTTGGSGPAGAIAKGDVFRVSVAGTLGGVAYSVGGSFRALIDAPGQTAGNWATITQDDNAGTSVVYASSTEAKAKTEGGKATPPSALTDFVYSLAPVQFGNGALTQFDFTHAFTTVTGVKIKKVSDNQYWNFLVTETSGTNVRVNTGIVPTTNEFEIVISGK